MSSASLRAAHRAAGNFHWVIDGEPVETIKRVFTLCRNRGYDGSLQNLHYRLSNGINTWAELSKPVDKEMYADRKKAAARTAARKKSEMHDICAELDARKKALAAKGKEE